MNRPLLIGMIGKINFGGVTGSNRSLNIVSICTHPHDVLASCIISGNFPILRIVTQILRLSPSFKEPRSNSVLSASIRVIPDG